MIAFISRDWLDAVRDPSVCTSYANYRMSDEKEPGFFSEISFLDPSFIGFIARKQSSNHITVSLLPPECKPNEASGSITHRTPGKGPPIERWRFESVRHRQGAPLWPDNLIHRVLRPISSQFHPIYMS